MGPVNEWPSLNRSFKAVVDRSPATQQPLEQVNAMRRQPILMVSHAVNIYCIGGRVPSVKRGRHYSTAGCQKIQGYWRCVSPSNLTLAHVPVLAKRL